MKTRNLLAALLLATFAFSVPTAFAQGTAFTYQGRLNDGAGPANGIYDLQFTIYDSPTNGVAVAGPVTNAATAVSNGLFTVNLDFGALPFNGADRWLEIGVRTNGTLSFALLTPRQKLAATPYAIFSEGVNAAGISGVIPATNVSGAYGNAVNFGNPGNSFYGAAFYGSNFIGSGSGLSNVWHTGGDVGTIAGLNFVGTVDNQPLEMWAGNQRALRLEPFTIYGAPNVIGGAPVNVVSNGVFGATIAGGGAASFVGSTPNRVSAIFGTIGGGKNNYVAADHGFIGAGHDNEIDVIAYDSVVGGGSANLVQSNAAGSVIGGGYQNSIGYNSSSATIAGGYANVISFDSYYATIGGGYDSFIGTNSGYATISAGYINKITDNSPVAMIGGGWFNTISTNSTAAAIGGGGFNGVGTNSLYATIGGGGGNQIFGSSSYASISGGQNNVIGFSAQASVIGGGEYNTNQSFGSVVGGGMQNMIQANVISGFGVLGGGYQNIIQSNAPYGALVGGIYNLISANSFDGAIGGGAYNQIQGVSPVGSTIPGGYSNTVAGSFGMAAGRRAKAIYDGDFVWADAQDADFAATRTNQFLIRAAGGVGIGTNAPHHQLRVSGGPAWTANGWGGAVELDDGAAIGWNRDNNGQRYGIGHTTGGLYFFRTASDPGTATNPAIYDVVLTDNGNVGIGTLTPSTLLQVGDATCNGSTWNTASDRNLKENFRDIDSRAVLEKVAALPVSEWNYKQETTARHIGPMAQDFYAAFGVGTDDRHIATVDEGGVALAAIQGLNQKLEQKEAEINDLKQRLEELERIVREKSE